MPSRRCAADGRKFQGSAVTLYVAYWPQANEKRRLKAYVCPEHADVVVSMRDIHNEYFDQPEEEDNICVGCQKEKDHSGLCTYITAYVPDQEKVQWELWLCIACTAHWRSLLSDHSTPLENTSPNGIHVRAGRGDVWSGLLQG